MDQTSKKTRIESITSFQSTIRKMEKALTQMQKKDVNTTLIRKRLSALRIGLASIEYDWSAKVHEFSEEELLGAREVLYGLLPSINRAYLKSQEGSPQRTLLLRRIISIEQSINVIDEITYKYKRPDDSLKEKK